MKKSDLNKPLLIALLASFSLCLLGPLQAAFAFEPDEQASEETREEFPRYNTRQNANFKKRRGPASECVKKLPREERQKLRQCISDKKNGEFDGKCTEVISKESQDALKKCMAENRKQLKDAFKQCTENLSFESKSKLRACMATAKASEDKTAQRDKMKECLSQLSEQEQEDMKNCMRRG